MRISLIACIVLASAAAGAQEAAPPGAHGGGTATRSVAHYSGLEYGLLEALQAHDEEALRQSLAQDFEVREPDDSEAIDGADWVRNWMGGRLRSFRIYNLSVREFGDTAVVSFLLQARGRIAHRALPPVSYVVDVWRDERLAVRYVSTPARAAPLPAGPNRRE